MMARSQSWTSAMPPSLQRIVATTQELIGRGRFGEARARLEQAMRDQPEDPGLNLLLGRVLYLSGRSTEAESHFLKTLAVAPGMLASVVGLCQVWKEIGKLEPATALLKQYLVQSPENGTLIAELAAVLFSKRDFQRAIDLNRWLLITLPDSLIAHANIAESLSKLQRNAEALSYIDMAIDRNPASDQLRMNRAFELLSLGRFKEGWKAYEARLLPGIPDSPKRFINIPRWTGEDISGKHILVCYEQGLGDHFLFAAFIAPLREMAARVSIETDPRQITLFQRSFPKAKVFAASRRLSGKRPIFAYAGLKKGPDYPDLHIDLASLPYLLGEGHQRPLAPRGYLRPDPAIVEHWRRRLRELSPGRPVIGLFWRSGPSPPRAKIIIRPLSAGGPFSQWPVPDSLASSSTMTAKTSKPPSDFSAWIF
jgi:tetratricopeptide (TPR) repeat protein